MFTNLSQMYNYTKQSDKHAVKLLGGCQHKQHKVTADTDYMHAECTLHCHSEQHVTHTMLHLNWLVGEDQLDQLWLYSTPLCYC